MKKLLFILLFFGNTILYKDLTDIFLNSNEIISNKICCVLKINWCCDLQNKYKEECNYLAKESKKD